MDTGELTPHTNSHLENSHRTPTHTALNLVNSHRTGKIGENWISNMKTDPLGQNMYVLNIFLG